MSDYNKFDFKKPYQSGEDFDSYVKETEYHLKNRIDSKTTQSNLVGIVSVLAIGIISLSGYIYWDTNQRNSTSNSQSQKSVAGVQETPIQNIFSGEGFSIMSKMDTPKGFQATKQSVDFTYIKGKKGIETTYAVKQNIQNNIVTNSISIVSSENDNKYDIKEFTGIVNTVLGKDYKVDTQETTLPKNVKIFKIYRPADGPGVNYYASITSDNYYVIKVVNESSVYPDLEQYTKFTNGFIEGLYLN